MEQIKIIWFVILAILTYLQAKKIIQEPSSTKNKEKSLQADKKDQSTNNPQHPNDIKQDLKTNTIAIDKIIDIDNEVFAQFQQKSCKIQANNGQTKQIKNRVDDIDNSFQITKYSKGKMFEMQQSRIIYDANYFHKNPFQKEQTFNNMNFLEPKMIIRTNDEYLSKIQHLFKPLQYADKINQSMCIQTNNTNNSMMDQQSNNIIQGQQAQGNEVQNKPKNKWKKKTIKKKKNHNKTTNQGIRQSNFLPNFSKNVKKSTKLQTTTQKNENLLDLQEQIERRQLELMILKNIKKNRLNKNSI